LIEVLISISLLSIVLLSLYNSVAMLRHSNAQLFDYLEKAEREKLGTETMFLDIAGSDGNISIAGDEYARLCMENTDNSIYELPSAKVCWVVTKKEKRLLRVEGNHYRLPLGSEAHVAVDTVMERVDLFHVYRSKENVLVVLQQKGKESVSFLVQGIPKPVKKKKKKKKLKKKKQKSIPLKRGPAAKPPTSGGGAGRQGGAPAKPAPSSPQSRVVQ
jgi:predicted CoA-binding protein